VAFLFPFLYKNNPVEIFFWIIKNDFARIPQQNY